MFEISSAFMPSFHIHFERYFRQKSAFFRLWAVGWPYRRQRRRPNSRLQFGAHQSQVHAGAPVRVSVSEVGKHAEPSKGSSDANAGLQS